MSLNPQCKDIDLFFTTNNKCDNDISNSIRENVILYIINREIPNLTSYTSDQNYGQKWSRVINQLNKIFDEIFLEFESKYKEAYTYDVIHIGGRKNNDFTIRIYNLNNKQIHEIKIEFKNNSDKIEKLPEILQLYENKEYYNDTIIPYNEFYYDNVIVKLIKDFNMPNITKQDYLKIVNTSGNTESIKKYDFLWKLYEIRNIDEKKFDSTHVDTSINDWLSNNKDIFKIAYLGNKIREKQTKIFIMWKFNGDINQSKFYLDKINFSRINELKFKELKGGTKGTINTVVLSDGINEFHCLLRWKNYNGIRGTAWQIKLKLVN